jgi:DNA-binding response OmpR family regulator
MKNQPMLLVAVPVNLSEIGDFLEASGFPTARATSPDAIHGLLEEVKPDGAILFADWIFLDEGNDLLTLFDDIPSVFLIGKTNWQEIISKVLFQHEYCTIPVDKEELLIRLQNVITIQLNQD